MNLRSDPISGQNCRHMLVCVLYLLAMPVVLNKGIPGSHRGLTSLHLTYWFLKQQRQIAMLLRSLKKTKQNKKTLRCNIMHFKGDKNSIITKLVLLILLLVMRMCWGWERLFKFDPCVNLTEFVKKECWRIEASRWTNLGKTDPKTLKSETAAKGASYLICTSYYIL